MSLEGSVHLPVVGDAKKKQLVIAAAGVLLVGVYLYRKRQAAAAAANTSSTDAGSGSVSSTGTDPATGYPYGSPEDTAALQASQMAAYGGYSGAVGGGGGGGALSTPPASGSSGGFATNAAWAQAAEDYLAGTTGGDPNAVSAALGKYLTGGVLTDAQVTIVQSAIAFEGYPPVAGDLGYPPSYHSGSAGGLVPVQGPPADVAPGPIQFLHTIGPVQRNTVNFGWTIPKGGGADHYEVYMDGREIGTTWATNTYAGNLKPSSRHTFAVIAVSHGGKKSSPVSMSVTTAK